jgi:hypothetical protein
MNRREMPDDGANSSAHNYLEPSMLDAASHATHPGESAVQVGIATFTDLELKVISLAQRRSEYDGRLPSSLISRFLMRANNILGNRRPQRLANDQLESLRRLVSELRFRSNGPHDSTLSMFLAAGYDLASFDILRSIVPRAPNEAHNS